MKKFQKVFEWLKDTQSSSSPWFSLVPSLQELCQAMVARNEPANL